MAARGDRFEEIDYRRLGKRIRKCRQDKGLSQEKLAERISASKNHMGYVETGKRSVSLLLLVRISNALEVSIEDLLVDSLEFVNSEAESEIKSILNGCSDKKAGILISMMKKLDKLMSANGWI